MDAEIELKLKPLMAAAERQQTERLQSEIDQRMQTTRADLERDARERIEHTPTYPNQVAILYGVWGS